MNNDEWSKAVRDIQAVFAWPEFPLRDADQHEDRVYTEDVPWCEEHEVPVVPPWTRAVPPIAEPEPEEDTLGPGLALVLIFGAVLMLVPIVAAICWVVYAIGAVVGVLLWLAGRSL